MAAGWPFSSSNCRRGLKTTIDETEEQLGIGSPSFTRLSVAPQHPSEKGESPMVKSTPPKQPRNVIFRRYRKLPNGTVLDAYDYGLKAWPLYIK